MTWRCDFGFGARAVNIPAQRGLVCGALPRFETVTFGEPVSALPQTH